MEMDLFDKMEKANIKQPEIKTDNRLSDLKFQINEDDNELLVIIKNLVNERDITYNQLYDKFGKRLGWNMIHGARKHQISWERFKKWMDLLDMEIDLTISPKKNE